MTVHGRVEEGENLKQALAREVREEVAAVLDNLNLTNVPENYKPDSLVTMHITLQLLSTRTTTKKQVVTMGCVIDDPTLFRLLNESLPSPGNLPLDNPSFRIVRESELDSVQIIDLSDPSQKKEGFTGDELAMFADELQAVRNAFQKIM